MVLHVAVKTMAAFRQLCVLNATFSSSKCSDNSNSDQNFVVGDSAPKRLPRAAAIAVSNKRFKHLRRSFLVRRTRVAKVLGHCGCRPTNRFESATMAAASIRGDVVQKPGSQSDSSPNSQAMFSRRISSSVRSTRNTLNSAKVDGDMVGAPGKLLRVHIVSNNVGSTSAKVIAGGYPNLFSLANILASMSTKALACSDLPRSHQRVRRSH
mmetsp:Transcript_93506/g.194977  ORF Transcript_93506/g.194977 Transcript_93506/m.194977 type:complete len:210 (+) Transcript_93506:361-990(+)